MGGMIARRLRPGLLFVLLASMSVPVMAQVDKSAYHPIAYDAILREHGLAEKPATDKEINFFPPALKYRIGAVSTGAMRALTPSSRDFLKTWSGLSAQLPAFVAHYAEEVEITEGGKPHWVMLQRNLAEPYGKEVKPGGKVDLYVILAGAVRGELMLLATEFEARWLAPTATESYSITRNPRGTAEKHSCPLAVTRKLSLVSKPRSPVHMPRIMWKHMLGSSTVMSSLRRLAVRSPQVGG
jgi:hypothetical protein